MRTIFINSTVFFFVVFAITVEAQDWRSHGPLPAVKQEIIAALDSAAPELKQKIVLVSSRAACPPGPKVILEKNEKTIAEYFAGYYLEDVEFLRVSVSGRLIMGPNLVGYLIDAPGKS